MRGLLRGALVIARRDYLETVLSPSFLSFLIAPFLLLAVGALATMISGESDIKSMKPIVAIVATEQAEQPLRAAHAELDLRTGATNWFLLKRYDPEADLDAQAARLLDPKRDGVNLVLLGYPDRPRLMGSAKQLMELAGPVELTLVQAKMPRLLRAHNLPPPVSGMRLEVVEGSDVGAGAGRVMMGRSLQLLMFFVIFIQGGMLLSALHDEKRSRIIDTLLSAISVEALLVGKVLAMLATSASILLCWAVLGMTGFALLAGMTNYLVTPQIGWPLFALLSGCYFLLGYFAYGAILIGLAGFADNARQIQMISMPLSALQFVVFMCATTGLTQPGSAVAQFAEWFPLSTTVAMAGRAAVDDAILPHLIAIPWMLIWVVILFWLAAKMFRRGVMS